MSMWHAVVAAAFFSSFFFNDTATTEIYTLSLHDALPISGGGSARLGELRVRQLQLARGQGVHRSEEHTSELQSQSNLVCRLLLEKKKKRSPCVPDGAPRHLTLAALPTGHAAAVSMAANVD